VRGQLLLMTEVGSAARVSVAMRKTWPLTTGKVGGARKREQT
jgi:hypothetical protein